MTAEAKVILTAQDRTAAAFRSARTNLDALNRSVGGVQNLLAKFGVGFSVAAVTTGLVSAAKSAIELGDNLQKAAARTGISASEFSTLAGAAKVADIDMASLSTALKKMQVALSEAATGAKGPQEALSALGLKIEDIKNLNADDQFLLLANQISKLKDPADKARLAVELFGKAGADLLPFFEQGADGIRQAREEIEKLGGKLTEEQIKALADADTKIKLLDQSWTAFATTLTAKVAPALADVFRKMADGLNGGRESQLRRQIDVLKELEKQTFTYTTNASGQKMRVTRGSGALLAGLPDVKSGYYSAEEITKAREELERQLSQSSRRFAPGGRDRRSSAERMAGDPPGPKPPGETDAERRARLKKELEAQFPDINLSAQRITTSAVDEVNKAIREQSLPQYQRDAEQWAKEAADAYAALAVGSISPEQYSARLKELNDKYLEDIKLGPKMEEVEQFSKLSVFAEEAARNMQSAFADFFYSFDGGLKGMLASFVDTIRKMVAQLIASQLLTAFFNWGAGFFGAGSGIGRFFRSMSKGITGKAIGGPVMAGMPYKVGERGAEMFVPSSNGMIVPNHAMAGGVNLNYTIDARGADAERIMAIMPGLLKRTKDEAVSEIRSLVARGRM